MSGGSSKRLSLGGRSEYDTDDSLHSDDEGATPRTVRSSDEPSTRPTFTPHEGAPAAEPALPLSLLASPYLASACFGPNTFPSKRPAIYAAVLDQLAAVPPPTRTRIVPLAFD